VDQVQNSFVDRDAAAAREDHHRHDQCPEVQLLAVAEGVLFIGRLLAQADSQEQQAAVAGIDNRVNSFGQHGGAAAEPCGRELGRGDDQIRDQRRIDRLLRAGLH
jgi:hypothetical protein